MITYEQLRAGPERGLLAAAETWSALDRSLGRCETRLRDEVVVPARRAWEGAAAERALVTLRTRTDSVVQASAAVTGVRAALEHAARRFGQLREELARVEQDAAAAGFAPGPGGVMVPGPGHAERYGTDESAALRADAVRAGLQARVNAALGAADETDTACGHVLERLHPDSAVPGHGAAVTSYTADAARLLGVSPTDVPAGDPARAAAWWAGLPPERRELYAEAFPRVLGATDGLPAAVRDRANRRLLAEAIANGPRELVRGDAPPGRAPDLSNLLALRGHLQARESGPAGRPLLLAFDAAADGRAVVALGDPDTARHVAVHVPGTGTDVRNLGLQLERAQRLREAADALDPRRRGEVATVAWLGYDAPDDLAAAAGHGAARDGAVPLERFVTGLRAAGAPDAHLTVSGHSYGSVVVGEAARRGGGLDADDIVVTGSPGMHVGHARDLGTDPGHVWSLTGALDPVPALGRPVHGADGRVPGDAAFGANVLEAGGGGHSSYWEVDPVSGRPGPGLESQARVVAGTYAAPDPAAHPRPAGHR